MTQIVFISLCAILVKVCLGDLTCGFNEIEITCPSNCATQHCPKSANYDHSCRQPDRRSCPIWKPPKGCVCQFNHKRAENGTCIPTTSCPKFDCEQENEEYVACPPYCPSDDCSQATPNGRCLLLGGFVLIVVECQPACRCIKGYWRKKGLCVPYDECPMKRVI